MNNFCLTCNKKIEKDRKFCSRKCHYNRIPKRIKKECLFCKKTFEIIPYYKTKRKFCSHNCYSLSRIGIPPSNKGKKKSKESIENQKIKLKKAWKDGKYSKRKKMFGDDNPAKRPEVRKKISEKTSREKHWNWQGGEKIVYPKVWNKILRRFILERDNFSCQFCNSTKKLVVHHKDKNKNNCKQENLITLCRSCHMRVHNGKRN